MPAVLALVLFLLPAAVALRAQQCGNDPACTPVPPMGWTRDLAPGPPEPPASMTEAQHLGLLPGVVIELLIPGEDRRLPLSDPFGDGHSQFYGGEVLEDPARGPRLGGAAKIPF